MVLFIRVIYQAERAAADRERNVEEERRQCPVCLGRQKKVALNCGHQLCQECAHEVTSCPSCRETITTRIVLFSKVYVGWLACAWCFSVESLDWIGLVGQVF